MLILRILTAVPLGAVVLWAILFAPPLLAGCLLGILWLAGVREWTRFAGLGPLGSALFIGACAAVMAVLSMAENNPAKVIVLVLAAVTWWLLVSVWLWRFPCRIAPWQAGVAGLVTLLPAWGLLAYLYGSSAAGPLQLLLMLCIVWAADVGAYFAGRRLGRRRLAPAVSPGKTWEGVAGGALLAALVGGAGAHLLELPYRVMLPLALLTALVSVVGDLNVSMFKRNAGLKDSGKLLPGHGGVLDRVDSITAAVAAYVAGLLLAGIIT